MIEIHPEQPRDTQAIRRVVEACFPSPAEAGLVESLREAGALAVSLIARHGDRVVGHVAFSPVAVAHGPHGVGLAPLSVMEGFRRQGIGAALTRAGLRACCEAGWGWAVVLGEPAYYQRFGFAAAARFGLTSLYDAGDAFQAMELLPGGLPRDGGLVRYAPAFDSV